MADRIPRLVAGVDVRKFRLDPTDGFLLTRIDGRLGSKDLARETGLAELAVERALEKLEKLGIVERIAPSAPPSQPDSTGAASPASAPRSLPPVGSSTTASSRTAASSTTAPARARPAQFGGGLFAPKYDPKELDEPVDLTVEQKQRVLDYFYRLDDLDHYTLLGVSKQADKKTVKRAYFELAGTFHPDRYYRKNLGSFKHKMEVLFTRITDAHDTLVDPAKRIEYDAYLDEVATTRGMEAMLERALAEAGQAAIDVPPATSGAALARFVPKTLPASGPASERIAPPPPSAADVQARREALARRLVGGASMRPSAPSGASAVPSGPNPLHYASTHDAMDAMKRRYELRTDQAAQAQARKYLEAADDALAKNDVVAAASSLSIALRFVPDDAALAARYAELKAKADEVLCASYEKQAAYEERAQHWTEAARNWQRVARIKPDYARAHERAAYTLVRADEPDLHQAADHAKKAIALEPKTVTHHVTLLEVFVKAGLTASAKRAAEAVLQLDPKNQRVPEILKRLKA